MKETHKLSDLANILAKSASSDGPKIEIFKFGRNPGTSVSGMLVEDPQLVQQREYVEGSREPGPLKFWPSGDPVMQVVLTLDTGLSESAGDDGLRKVYLSSRKQLEALGKAVAAAGVSEPKLGGQIKITFTSYGDPGPKGGVPKLYEVKYEAPAESVSGGKMKFEGEPDW